MDARLVHHYFATKQELFVAALNLPAHPEQMVRQVMEGPRESTGARLVRVFFTLWDDPVAREPLLAVLRSALNSPEAARMLREFLTRELFGQIVAQTGTDQVTMRAALVESQLIGLALGRYVLTLEPVASASLDQLVLWVGPGVQRYLVEPIVRG